MSDSGNPADTGANGAAVDMAAIQKLIEDGVGKALAARLPRVKNTEETIAKMVADAVAKLAPQAEKPAEQQAAGGEAATAEKLTLKALHEQVKSVTDKLAASEKARTEAENRARDTRNRAAFEQKLAAKLGADSPLLGPLMDSFYDVKKRVVEQDGRLAVKFVDPYGNEEYKPMEEGISTLFDNGGEFHPLVQQNRAGQLPPRMPNGANPQTGRNGQSATQAPRNPIHEEVARHYTSQGQHEVAAVFNAPAQVPVPGSK